MAPPGMGVGVLPAAAGAALVGGGMTGWGGSAEGKKGALDRAKRCSRSTGPSFAEFALGGIGGGDAAPGAPAVPGGAAMPGVAGTPGGAGAGVAPRPTAAGPPTPPAEPGDDWLPATGDEPDTPGVLGGPTGLPWVATDPGGASAAVDGLLEAGAPVAGSGGSPGGAIPVRAAISATPAARPAVSPGVIPGNSEGGGALGSSAGSSSGGGSASGSAASSFFPSAFSCFFCFLVSFLWS